MWSYFLLINLNNAKPVKNQVVCHQTGSFYICSYVANMSEKLLRRQFSPAQEASSHKKVNYIVDRITRQNTLHQPNAYWRPPTLE